MAAGRDELNRINVFPVPDGDTGTNMCLTLRAVAGALRGMGDGANLSLPHVAETMAQASVRGARGNSGMMLSQFLLGFRDGIGERLRISARELAAAIALGFERLRASLDEPMEGTILTVAREAADEAGRAGAESDLRVFMSRVVHRAEQALQRTPELLAVLKSAGVVDAGAKGFVRFLDGVKRLIDEGQIAEGAVDRLGGDPVNAAAQTEVEADRDYRYCTELMVRSPSLPDPAVVRKALREHGGSIVVLATGDLLKAHIHTDAPDAVFQLAGTWGTLESTKADDMRAQHQALQARRPIAFVSDTACDLPDELVLQYDIGLVPMNLIVDERSYRDRLELTAGEFFERMRAGLDASTSQPAPQAFEDGYRDAIRAGDHVITVTVSSALSGTHANAAAAAKRLAAAGATSAVTVVDSRSASLGEGLLVVRGVELAAAGWEAGAIVEELQRVRAQSGGFFTVDNFERLVRSGRIGRGRAWLGTKLNLKPVMALTMEGKIEPVARARGRDAAKRRILELLERALTPRPAALRLGVAHGDIPEFADALRAELVARFRPRQCLVTPITPVIAAHAGIGAWGVFYQNEDRNKGDKRAL
ncbi:MAG TPA: DegV family protein [Gemmatimonadales bacterium]|nr:DegV family protein [Gemmatimonadales bacterium]